MRIGVYTICKNEEKHIARMIESVLEADEIVILDTGSTDNTISIIEEIQKENSNVRLYSATISPWRFDDAKNMALSLLSLDIDLCVSLDADELLQSGWYTTLKNVDTTATRINHRFRTEWENGSISEHWHERIHSRLQYKWSLPVHEILEYSAIDGSEKIAWSTDLMMIQRPDRTKSRSSYFELLKQSVKERKNVWKSWFFLAQEYEANGDASNAVGCLLTALDVKDADVAFISSYLSDIYYRHNNKDMCLQYALKAANTRNIREYWIYASNKALHFGESELADLYNKIGKAITHKTDGYEYNQEVWK